MPLKLIYTSAPRLLQAGRSGFGTVAMSRDIPFQAVKLAEECSKFSRQSGLSSGRVVYSYRTVRCADGLWHVLSCVRDAGTDYSGRTNHLAQHLMFDSREASECARAGKTPAGVMLGTAWPDHDGFCGWIDGGVHWEAHEPDPTWQWWTHYAGSGYCRLHLSSEAALRGAVLVYGKGLEMQTAEDARAVLCLYAESQAGCPDRGWGVTFTTNLEPNDELSEFRWIGVPENSPMLPKIEATGGRVRVTFDLPPPAPRQPQAAAALRENSSPVGASQDSRQVSRQSSGGAAEIPPAGQAVKPPPVKPTAPRLKHGNPDARRRANPVLLAAIGVVALVAAALLVRAVLAPVEVRFGPDSLVTTYDRNAKRAVLEQPANGVVNYAGRGSQNWSRNPPFEAGVYDLRIEVPAWFGLATRFIPRPEKLTIDPAESRIEFPAASFIADGKDKVVAPIIKPPEAGDRHVVEYRKKGQSGDSWTTNAFSLPGSYEVRVKIREGNYKAAVATNAFVIEPSSNRQQKELGGVLASMNSDGESARSGGASNTGAAGDINKGSDAHLGQNARLTRSAAISFLLADESKMLPLLAEKMPRDGNLYVYLKETGKWSKVDRGQGKRADASWDEPDMFRMKDGIPAEKKAPDRGPLVYMVGPSENAPAFVAIELQKGDEQSGLKGDNSGALGCFFEKVCLENVNGKPALRFYLRNGTESVGLDKFETALSGERFIFEYSGANGYAESNPLWVVLPPSGELDLSQEIANQTASVEGAKRQIASAAPHASSEDYFSTAKTAFLSSLAQRTENTNRISPNSLAQQLYKEATGLQMPAPSATTANPTKNAAQYSLIAVTTIVGQVLHALERNPDASRWITLTGDNERRREAAKPQTQIAGSDYVEKLPDALLTADELRTRMGNGKSVDALLASALDWIRGRERDMEEHGRAAKAEEKPQLKCVEEVLNDLRKGLNNLKSLGSENPQSHSGKEPLDAPSTERDLKVAEGKRKFLEKLQRGEPVGDGERGRLLFGARDESVLLWPNVLLESSSLK